VFKNEIKNQYSFKISFLIIYKIRQDKMSECVICCLKYVKTRYPISCPKCEEDVCSKCCERYLLELHDDPNCMCCHTTWTKQFLIDNFTKTFVRNKYNKARQQVLMDRERALFPQTLERIAREEEINKYRKQLKEYESEWIHNARKQGKIKKLLAEKRKRLRLKTKNITATRKKIRIETGQEKEFQKKWLEKQLKDREDLKQEIEDGKKQQEELKNKQVLVMARRNEINDRYEELRWNRTATNERYSFKHKCPKEDCNGMLNSKFECVVCSNKACKDCYILLPENEEEKHTCKTEDKETFKMLCSKTKPCPNCHTLIFKIEGCNQMFCTQCHTPFSWTTGRIITGEFFHNPHYFDFINNGGSSAEVFGQQQEVNNDNCDRRNIRWEAFREKYKNLALKRDLDCIGYLIRKLRHAKDDKRDYEYNIVDANAHSRYRFIKNRITEKRYLQLLANNERKMEKYAIYHDLLDILGNQGEQIIFKYYDDVSLSLYNMKKEFEDLYGYIDTAFEKVSKDFKCVKLGYAHIQYGPTRW
jgi:hypothetical protein